MNLKKKNNVNYFSKLLSIQNLYAFLKHVNNFSSIFGWNVQNKLWFERNGCSWRSWGIPWASILKKHISLVQFFILMSLIIFNMLYGN